MSDSGVYASIEARSEPLGMCEAHCYRIYEREQPN